MKKRLTAYLLAFALVCGCVPAAFASQSADNANAAGADVSSLYEQLPQQEGSLTKSVAAQKTVFEPEILPQEQHENLADTVDFEEFAYSRNYSEEQAQSSENAALTATSAASFSAYGEQLSSLYYTFDALPSVSVYVGAAMKQLYDNMKADVASGVYGATFTANTEQLRRLGVSMTVPSQQALGVSVDSYKELLSSMAINIGWVVYRCVDYDCPEMFYSNGYSRMGYSLSGTTLTVYLLPQYRAGFESLSQREQLQSQLDAKINEVVANAAQYSRAYDKMKYFNDWLCANNEYNNEAIQNASYSEDVSGAPWSPVSAMLSGSDSSIKGPVCEGYARAFQLLCKKVGIQAAVIVSDSGWHMWNNVRYGNQWTGVDVTWNDSMRTSQYFCSTVNNIDGHVLDDGDFVPWFQYPDLSVISSSSELPFYDVSDSFWGRSSIQYVYERSYMVGTNCVTFGTNLQITRAEFAQLLYSIAGEPAVSYTERFQDVAAGKWYTNAVLWAAERGIVHGYTDGRYGVHDPIKREDLAVILYQYLGSPAAESVDLGARFTDADRIHDYAQAALTWAVSTGVMNGMDNGTLEPRGTATRAQSAVMISKTV
ncbi:MAG: S-layer homology domain-containing protein [Eubacteriales bacterium]|nr:S-layer homology domain-containing protein [Eubacteriales bacterium]